MNVKIIREKILLVKTFLSVWHERNTFTSWNKLDTMRSVIAICLDLPVLGRVDMVIGVLFSRFYPKWCTILAKLVRINQIMTVAFYDLYKPASHTVLDRKSNGEKNRWPSELRLGFSTIGGYKNTSSLTPTSLSLKAEVYWSETMIKHPPSF